jgi:hypothetical protein
MVTVQYLQGISKVDQIYPCADEAYLGTIG